MHSFALLVRTLAAPSASDPPNRRIGINTSGTKREAPPSALLMLLIRQFAAPQDRRVTKILDRAPFPTASALPLCDGQPPLPTSLVVVGLSGISVQIDGARRTAIATIDRQGTSARAAISQGQAQASAAAGR